MRFGVRGAAVLQVWLMIFGFVCVVGMMGGVSGAGANLGNFENLPGNYMDNVVEGDTMFYEGQTLKYDGAGGWDKIAGGAGSTSIKSTSSLLPSGAGSSTLSNFIGVKYADTGTGKLAARAAGDGAWRVAGSGVDALAAGLQWAVLAYFAGTMLGDMFGMSEGNSEALGTSLAAGAGVYKILSTYSFESGFGAEYLGPYAGPIGIGVGALVFVMMYKDVETKIVTFNCMPWQAPSGGDDCEVCNDAELPCSEYRCKSLGQSCEIVNEGTVEERCVYVNPRDVSPPIINPNYGELTIGHSYKNVKSSPPGPGFDIVYSGSRDGCLKAFTPLEFGLSIDEPAQCKIDFNHTTKFDDMVSFVGGSNLYRYNHSEVFSLPGASELQAGGFSLTNGKDMTFFIRCKDKNGNENGAEYAVNFCVDPTPDTTPAKIEATSIMNGGCVAENTEAAEVVFYVNEPANCKWSFQNQDYDLMENDMSCSTSYSQVNSAQLFGCRTSLTGIPRDGATYYIRCKDQPGKEENDRNENRESFEFELRGSTALLLKNLKPNETVFGGVSPAPIELYVETLFGCNTGRAVCEWSSDGNNYIQFFDTNNEDGIHTQRLDLVGGQHDYRVRCVDEGGNVVEETASFYVDIDTNAPVVARVYEEGGMLKIVTVRDSECSYSLDDCDFSVDEGVEMPYADTTIHVADWSEENTYYIKCRDEFLNEQASCSIVVRPTENFL